MRVLLVHLLSAHIKNFDAAHACLNRFAEPNTHLSWGLVHFASDPRLRTD